MDALYKVVVALHLLGMAVIVGGWIVTRGADRFPPAIVWAARAQFLLGLVIVGLAEAMDKSVNNPKVGVKVVLALVVVALAEIGNARSRRNESSRTQLDGAGGAGLLAALVAALW